MGKNNTLLVCKGYNLVFKCALTIIAILMINYRMNNTSFKILNPIKLWILILLEHLGVFNWSWLTYYCTINQKLSCGSMCKFRLIMKLQSWHHRIKQWQIELHIKNTILVLSRITFYIYEPHINNPTKVIMHIQS